MWVWGGLTLSYPQTVAEKKVSLFAHHSPPPPEAGGREGGAPFSFSSSLEQDTQETAPCGGLLMPIGKQLCPPWTSTPLARSPPSLVLWPP